MERIILVSVVRSEQLDDVQLSTASDWKKCKEKTLFSSLTPCLRPCLL